MTQRRQEEPLTILRCLFAVVMCTVAAPAVWAGPVTFYDSFMPADVFFRSSNGGACVGDNATDTVTGQRYGGCDTLAFSLGLPGYDSITDTLYTALVSLAFHDDNDAGSETLTIQLDTVTKNVTVRQGSTNTSPFFYTFWNPLDAITETGRVDLMLSQVGGDFWFDGAGIAAAGTRLDAPTPALVPEPASLVLLGTGIVGMLTRVRRRRRS